MVLSVLVADTGQAGNVSGYVNAAPGPRGITAEIRKGFHVPGLGALI